MERARGTQQGVDLLLREDGRVRQAEHTSLPVQVNLLRMQTMRPELYFTFVFPHELNAYFP